MSLESDAKNLARLSSDVIRQINNNAPNQNKSNHRIDMDLDKSDYLDNGSNIQD
jgi:hypothetical protein